MHRAAYMGDVHRVMTCLQENPGINLDALSADGSSALYIACTNGHSSVASVLIRAGADANLRCGPTELTPLHASVSGGHIGMLRQLVEAGGDLSIRASRGLAVAHLAVLADSQEGLHEVVKLGADLDVQDHCGMTALMICAGYPNTENASGKAQILLNGGAHLDLVDAKGETALLFAVNSENYGVLQVLLDAGASLTDRSSAGETAVMTAAANGYLEVVRLLCDAGADLSDRNSMDYTPLMMAATNGHSKVVQLLRDAGADISDHDGAGVTALVVAAYEGKLEMVQYLIEAGASIMPVIATGASPLQAAAVNGHTEIVQELISAGADVNHSSREFNVGMTAMHLAAGESHVDTVRLLLMEGSLETATDENGCRPACLIGQTLVEKNPLNQPLVRVLLARGPALRADFWLWPRESAAETSPCSSAQEQAGADEGSKKMKRVPLDPGMLRRRHSRKDTMTILVRYANVKSVESTTGCYCRFCTART